jgi:PAS domain-containing protein
VDILNISEKPGSRFLKVAAIPACVLFGIIVADHYFLRGATITPTCNFLAMGIFALYLHPRLMVFWACCFACSSLFMLNRPAFSQPGPFDKVLTTDSRSIGTVVGAVVAVLLCTNRWKASKSNAQLVTLVKRLPVPFVLSDKNGTLLYISDEAGHLMNVPPKEAAGQSYFALLFNLSEKGASIQRYVNLLDSAENKESIIELRLLSCPEKSWRGILMPVDLEVGRCLITVIEPLPKA